MPASSRPVPVHVADDVWYRHEAQIKYLYQNKRKTLQEVKKRMEEDGFPEIPMSTWESKLRETLQLRKKAKAHDWPLIYQHILPRLEHPRKKKFKRQTVIRLNNSKIPWDKAWKEIRRSGAFRNDYTSTIPIPLPPEITIRTPSPGPCTPSPVPRAAQPVISDVSTNSNSAISLALFSSQTSSSVVAPIVQPGSSMYSSASLLQWCASTIPWLQMCQSIQSMIRGGNHTQQLEVSFSSVLNEFLATSAIARAVRSETRNKIISSDIRLDLLQNGQPIPPRPSPDLGYRVARSSGQIELSQFIATAVFLLSNQLHDNKDGDQGLELLCSLLDRDVSLTTTLLRSHVPSIRATWESLLLFAIRKRRRDRFRLLVDIGIHNHWLDPSQPGRCLFCAVEMECYDIVTKVVAYCCDSNHKKWWWHIFEAILAACRQGNLECATLMIKHCDVNFRAGWHVLRKTISMFEMLLLKYREDELMLALELFLANGANVDRKVRKGNFLFKWRKLVRVSQDELLVATQPTILDQVFYSNRPLFDKLRPWSKVPALRITRTGLLVALEDGPQTLRHYLSARQSVLPSFNWQHARSVLELLLAEQFTVSEKVDFKILRGLYEFGVDFTMPSVEIDLQDFWRKVDGAIRVHFDFAWHQIANVNHRIWLLNMLLSKGGVIGELVLEGAVAQYGTDGLESLASHLTDFSTKAVRALARAARANKFQDVEFLLRKGVDPNAFVVEDGLSYSIQAMAIRSSGWLPDGGCSLEMTRFLARHGAKLVVSPQDSTPFDFAIYLLEGLDVPDLIAKVKYVLSTSAEDKTLARLPSFLLEACLRLPGALPLMDQEQRLEMFEYLFRQGAEVSPGSPLAALIALHGREELVREVLYSGSDLNAYFESNIASGAFTPLQTAAQNGEEDLVRLLLREGANVNSPARGQGGFTALQGACGWPPATEEEHQLKMRICRLLIEQGADINASPSQRGGTALTNAAAVGDLELAMMLLRDGADVNAVGCPCPDWNETALDRAAGHGRLDMVNFLLTANALSAHRGATGYVGAISAAERTGRLAVADLIREHVAKVEAGTVFNPELLEAQEGRSVPVYSKYDEYSADDYEPSSDDYESSSDDYESPSDDTEDVGITGETSGPIDSEPGYREAAQTLSLGGNAVPEGGDLGNLDPASALSEEEWPFMPDMEHIQPVDLQDPTGSWTG